MTRCRRYGKRYGHSSLPNQIGAPLCPRAPLSRVAASYYRGYGLCYAPMHDTNGALNSCWPALTSVDGSRVLYCTLTLASSDELLLLLPEWEFEVLLGLRAGSRHAGFRLVREGRCASGSRLVSFRLVRKERCASECRRHASDTKQGWWSRGHVEAADRVDRETAAPRGQRRRSAGTGARQRRVHTMHSFRHSGSQVEMRAHGCSCLRGCPMP